MREYFRRVFVIYMHLTLCLFAVIKEYIGITGFE
jgi:hypothetical protein